MRTIGLVPRGERHTSVEIELANLSVDDLKNVIQPYADDPLFYDPYPIETENKSFFEIRYGITFDFEHFDYYLLCGFDHSEEATDKNTHQL
jgi:hypothetical protein